VRSAGSLFTMGGGRPPSTFGVAECCSVQELEFQLLEGETLLSCRKVQCEVLGFWAPWGNRASGAIYRMAGYSFPSCRWGIWHSHPLVREQVLSCCQGHWGMLGLHALCGGKPPGVSRVAKPGAWGSLWCVVAGSCTE
jgi:hypothetical protein